MFSLARATVSRVSFEQWPLSLAAYPFLNFSPASIAFVFKISAESINSQFASIRESRS
jgi:hypothetical protein